jgi:hypothetical protein
MKLRATTGDFSVDRERGIIRGAAVAHVGTPLGHSFDLDAQSLLQLKAAIDARGVPVRLTHPRDGGPDPLPTTVGIAENARIASGVLRADVRLLSSERRDFLLDLAENAPESFGLSVDFEPTWESLGDTRLARVRKLNAIDFVSEPAINPRGLLESGERIMESLLKFLQTMGLPAEATEPEAVVTWLKGKFGDAAPSEGEQMAAKGGGSAVALAAVTGERIRATSIRDMARSLRLSADWAEAHVANGSTFEDACHAALEARRKTDAAFLGQARRYDDDDVDAEATLAAVTLSRMGRAELAAKVFGEHTLKRAYATGWHSMTDVCREACRLARIDTVGKTPTQVIRLAFSSASMPNALGLAGDKLAAAIYGEQPRTWEAWTGRRSVSNFRQHTEIRPFLGNGAYTRVPPGGELQHAVLGEETYQFAVHNFARMFSITLEDLRNDDLDAVGALIAELAREAPRTVSDAVYGKLLDNTGSFFAEARGNFDDGADSVLNHDGLVAATKMLRQQHDKAGRLIGFVPKILLVGADLEATATRLVHSLELRDTTADTQYPTGNPFHGKLEVVVEPRLSDPTFHESASATRWWLLAAPANACQIVAYLDDKSTPTIETAPADFDRLGQQMRGVLAFGTAFSDHRAAVQMEGA